MFPLSHIIKLSDERDGVWTELEFRAAKHDNNTINKRILTEPNTKGIKAGYGLKSVKIKSINVDTR